MTWTQGGAAQVRDCRSEGPAPHAPRSLLGKMKLGVGRD